MRLYDICETMARQKLGLDGTYELTHVELLPHAPDTWRKVKACLGQRVPRTWRQQYDRWENLQWLELYRPEIEAFPGYEPGRRCSLDTVGRSGIR